MTYRVRVRRGDFEIEVESVDKEFVEGKLREFGNTSSHQKTTQGDASRGAPLPLGASTPGKSLSMVELKKLVRAETGPENTVTVAYYLERFKGQPEYPVKDLVEGLKELRCNVKNPWDAVKKTRDAGYLMDGRSKRMLSLTDTGLRLLESRLQASDASNRAQP